MKTNIISAVALALAAFLYDGAVEAADQDPFAATSGPFTGQIVHVIDPAQIVQSLGVNHEGQVTAQCVTQLGVNQAGAACVVGRLTTEELNKCFTDGVDGRGCFGDSNTLMSMIRGNFEAAQRENGALNRTIRTTSGISVKDIKDNGITGGSNSLFNCLSGNC